MKLSTVRYLMKLVSFHNEHLWPPQIKEMLLKTCTVTPDFITEAEEKALLDEIEPHMKRLRYEKSHWDDQFVKMLEKKIRSKKDLIRKLGEAIHLYREREQRKWRPENEVVLQRIRDKSFKKGDAHLSYIHILDLHEDGVIKPHIDSVRYCGDVISGVSLLSNSVLRLRHKDDKEKLFVDMYLPRRSLYRMGEFGRYEFYHEILGKKESFFNGEVVPRERRISVICRDLPHSFVEAQEKIRMTQATNNAADPQS